MAHELRDGYFISRYQDQAATTTTNKAQPRHTDRTRGSRGKDNHRGGEKKRRSRDFDRDTSIIKIFFANITYYSAHAKAFLASREEDIVLLAETHQNARQSRAMMAELGNMGWECTSSPAGLSPKSEDGNIGGVLAGIKIFY